MYGSDGEEYVYVVACVWRPVVGCDPRDSNPDHIHVIAASERDAIDLAQQHTRDYPLYPLACWSPTDYAVIDRRPVGTLEPVDA